jgi:hypothetical protein
MPHTGDFQTSFLRYGYDVITYSKSSRPERILIQLSKIFAPDGLIIIAFPNAAGPIKYFNDQLTEIPLIMLPGGINLSSKQQCLLN